MGSPTNNQVRPQSHAESADAYPSLKYCVSVSGNYPVTSFYTNAFVSLVSILLPALTTDGSSWIIIGLRTNAVQIPAAYFVYCVPMLQLGALSQRIIGRSGAAAAETGRSNDIHYIWKPHDAIDQYLDGPFSVFRLKHSKHLRRW
ncbi:hypothetical protein N656DRAFT_783071 [Canariomyces notabilis]|uniref:Uncharacterized protein n=1 Tax=Canariomyces notabilis TaxID=2074819 RepID=A0AAN6QMT7_9PEZI|nr:hypothetical protein N656DRAFT_783071 [Canariomyces arenarius]